MCEITKENDSLQRQTENKDENSQELQCNKNIPELRFPEFEGEWEDNKIDYFFKISVAGDLKKEELSKFKINKFKYPVYGNALEKKGLLGYYENYKYEENNITVTARGNLGVALLRKKPFNAVGRLIILIPKTELNSYYVTQYINSKFKIYVESTGVPQLTAPSFRLNKIKIPKLNEQNKIAKFLSAIDKKIGFMEKEINKQSKYMKKIREIILNDNSDNSNKVQLKEICIINKGKQLNKTNMINDGKYYVLNGGKTPSGFTNSWNVPENTISISEGGNSCGFVNYNVQKFYCGGHCYYLTNISDEIDPLLLYHCLKMNENKIMNLRVGSGLPNIQKKDLEKYKLYIPTKNHEKITYLLNNINLKIDLNKEKLNHLKQFKKGLLQKMFC